MQLCRVITWDIIFFSDDFTYLALFEVKLKFFIPKRSEGLKILIQTEKKHKYVKSQQKK